MKLEVGMYVRINGRKSTSTKYQNFFMIDKIHHIDNGKSKYKYLIKEDKDGYCYAVSDEMITKASHNIKELLQVGDIITYEFPTGLGMLKYENVTILENLLDVLKNSDEYKILSIVTKEQFEQIQYKVGE